MQLTYNQHRVEVQRVLTKCLHALETEVANDC
jgi:hypothetical protein